MKAKIYSLKGKAAGEVELPAIFEADVRPDLIKRAVLVAQAARYQPHGVDWMAGKRTSAYSWGPGHAVSRVPRVKGSRYPAGGQGAFVPQAVGGRQAFPPVLGKKIREKINVKERRKAIVSALAATASKELVAERGHRIEKVPQLPLILEDGLEEVKTAKESLEILGRLGLLADLERAQERKVRPGKGKMRGRRYKNRKSLLIVVAKDSGIGRGAGNLPGVDVVTASSLGVEDLAPGTHYGRLTVFTKSAIERLEERFKNGAL